MGAKLNLDKLDLQIISEMMEDAQISYADLGKKLFVSGGTIHVRTTGNYSMFIEVVCKDINQLRFVLHDALQKIKGIERTETFISLDESFNRKVEVVQDLD